MPVSRPVPTTEHHFLDTAKMVRSARSLRTCHLPREETPIKPAHETRGYTPPLAEALDRDPNLTDGARRTGRILAAYIHRRDRTGQADITVTFLMRATGRCRRTVQNHLRQLERAGYIAAQVIVAATRMCAGLSVRLLAPLLPAHGWQKGGKPMKPGAQRNSQNHGFRYKISREGWAMKCSDGVWRSYVKTLPPLAPFPVR